MYLHFETKRALDLKQEQEKELGGGSRVLIFHLLLATLLLAGIRKFSLALYQEMTTLRNVNIPIKLGVFITNRVIFELSRGTIRVAVSTYYKLGSS